MKRFVLAAAVAASLASPALARDLTLTLTDADQQTLVQSLDAMMKVQGLTTLTNGTAAAVQALFQKLQAAAQAPEKPADANTPTGGAK